MVDIVDGKEVVLHDPEEFRQRPEKAFRVQRSSEKQFAFDHAFDQNASQTEVYSKTTQVLLDGVVNGFNATVFAYGATGAGKTYTMLGT
jgi:kinesin family protein 18/19